MTVMYSFCFWYSVRLGSIIVAFTCMMQCMVAFIAFGYGISDLERTSSNINYWLETSNLKMSKFLFEAVRNDPKSYLIALLTITCIYFCSCVSLIYAAFQCNVYFMYPFMVFDFIRLVTLSVALVIILMIVKENTLNLGIIMGSSISGAFTLLYLWYQWFCTVSLWQIIKEIERLENRVKKNSPNPPPMQTNFNMHHSLYNDPFYLPNVTL